MDNIGSVSDVRSHELFLELVELPAPQRAARLEQVGAADAAIRDAVEALLGADRNSEGFLESPLIACDLLAPSDVGGSIGGDPLVGRTIDGFVIQSRIGAGGMGAVYSARQLRPERNVAIKVVRGTVVSATAAQRLMFEADVLSRLKHPHVAEIYTAGMIQTDLGDLPFFAMEYVDGGAAITSYCKTHKLEVRIRLDLFLAVCSAVQHGHERGIIHRDLKPSNVLVDSAGNVKVIDFGISRVVDDDARRTTLLTVAGGIIGTLQYMSPEQCSGGAELDARADVYSMGAILYELVCDEPTHDFSTSSLEESLRTIRESPPVHPCRRNSKIDRDLAAIVLMALMKEPARRYASVSELAADLRRYLATEPITARRPTTAYYASLFVRRNPVLATLGAMLVITLLAATVVSTSLYWRASEARTQARQQRDDAESARVQAEAVTLFIQQMLASTDPENARGDDVAMSDVLAEADRTVGRELSDQPLVEAAVRLTIGRTYMNLGEIAEARRHLTRALELRQDHLEADHPDVVESLSAMAELRMAEGRFEEAAELNHTILELATRRFGAESGAVADVLGTMGSALRNMGRYREAEQALRRSLAICRRIDPDPVRTAVSLNNLGTLLTDRGDLAEAATLLEEAMALQREHLGDDHPRTAVSLNNLATALSRLGRVDDARRLLDESLAVRKQAYGEQHAKVALGLNALGSFLTEHGQAAEAEVYLREALAIRREVHRPNHPGVAVSLNNLALALSKLGRYDEARVLYRESLEVRRLVYGSDHLRVANGLRNLASVSRRMGDLETAEAYAREGLAIAKRRLEADDPELAGYKEGLAIILKSGGMFDKAAPLYREVLELRRKTFGEDHPRVANSELNLALLLLAIDNLDDAEALARQAVGTMQNVHGNDHVDSARALHVLGTILLSRDDPDGAEEALTDALAIQRQKLPADHADLAITLKSLGILWIRRQDQVQAESCLRESLAIFRQAFAADHLQIAHVESILGECLSLQGRYEEAEPLLLNSYRRIVAERGESGDLSDDARKRIVDMFEASGRPAEASQFRDPKDDQPNSASADRN